MGEQTSRVIGQSGSATTAPILKRPTLEQTRALGQRGYVIGRYRENGKQVWRISKTEPREMLPGRYPTLSAAYAHAVNLP